jgi:glyoxylase-like metal-dependent hydrolase (beta-lactamase superfamily II)
MIQIQTFTFNPFSENTYLVYDDTGEGVIIDPGCYEKSEKDELAQFIESKKIKVKYLLNTHCHIDHVLGNNFVKEKFQFPFLIHQNDEPVLRSVKAYAPSYGFNLYQEILPDGYVSEGDSVSFGNTVLEVIFLPGHAPGHIGFYHKESHSLLSGDVLFEQSIGRTDLPGGDFNTLIKSIHEKIFTLPDEVVVYPGHGNTTTVGEEKISNPFCALNLSR